MGVLGLLLNCLVILGVRSNRKLSTSINILLLWLCGASILEASLGVTAKCLVIGQFFILALAHAIIAGGVISDRVSRPYIDPVCRGLIAVPFFFSFTSQVLFLVLFPYLDLPHQVPVDLYLPLPPLPGHPVDPRQRSAVVESQSHGAVTRR